MKTTDGRDAADETTPRPDGLGPAERKNGAPEPPATRPAAPSAHPAASSARPVAPPRIKETHGHYGSSGRQVTVLSMTAIDPRSGLWRPEPIEVIHLPSAYDRDGVLVVKMRDDSMAPVIAKDAYVGLAPPRAAIRSGGVFAMAVIGQGLWLRRLNRDPRGANFHLHPDNPDHAPSEMPIKDLQEALVGQAVWVMHDI